MSLFVEITKEGITDIFHIRETLYAAFSIRQTSEILFSKSNTSKAKALLAFLKDECGGNGNKVIKRKYEQIKNSIIYIYYSKYTDTKESGNKYNRLGKPKSYEKHTLDEWLKLSNIQIEFIDNAFMTNRKTIIDKSINIIKSILSSYNDPKIKKCISIGHIETEEKESFLSGSSNNIDIGHWDVWDYTSHARDDDEYEAATKALDKFLNVCNSKLSALECKIDTDTGDWDGAPVTLYYKPEKK